ncbi:MAG: peptidase, partial [Chitinophagaceae bacterium]
MNRILSFFVLIVFIALDNGAAAQSLPVARNIQAAYQKGTRSVEGKPGKNYWQNKAAYTLRVKFNPETRLVAGTVDITYTNNSPDTLRQIWFKLYPNLYKTGTPRESAVSPRDLTEGVVIDSMFINGQIVNKANIGINGTNMTVNRQSLPGGKNMQFRISYHYTLNKTSHVRTGE